MNIDKFSRLILAERQELLDSLVLTPAATIEQYQNRVGQIRGLDRALELLHELLDDEK